MKREAVQEERQRNKEKGEMDMDASNGKLSKQVYGLKVDLFERFVSQGDKVTCP